MPDSIVLHDCAAWLCCVVRPPSHQIVSTHAVKFTIKRSFHLRTPDIAASVLKVLDCIAALCIPGFHAPVKDGDEGASGGVSSSFLAPTKESARGH